MARDDERADSDADVLAILDESADVHAVEETLRDVASDVTLKHGVDVRVRAGTTARHEARADHPFFETVLDEARPICG